MPSVIIVGLVLIVLAVLLFFGAVLGGGSGQTTIDLGLFHVTTTPTVVFLLGAGAMLVFFLGVSAIRRGSRHSRERRKDRKRVDELSRQLDAARRDAGEPPDPARTDGEEDRPTPL